MSFLVAQTLTLFEASAFAGTVANVFARGFDRRRSRGAERRAEVDQVAHAPHACTQGVPGLFAYATVGELEATACDWDRVYIVSG